MFYRPDLYEAGRSVGADDVGGLPRRRRGAEPGDVSGTSMIGANDVSLFLVDWYTRFITMGGELMSGTRTTKTSSTNLEQPEASRRSRT